MHCANSECHCELFDMPGGSIWLLQLELPREPSTGYSEDAFTLVASQQKYFWLCAPCSRRFVLCRWTPSGVVLAQRKPCGQYRNAREMEDSCDPLPFSVHASVQVEEEFLDVG